MSWLLRVMLVHQQIALLPEALIANMTREQIATDIVLSLLVLRQAVFRSEFPKADVAKVLFVFVEFLRHPRLRRAGSALGAVLVVLAEMQKRLRPLRLVDGKLFAAHAARGLVFVRS